MFWNLYLLFAAVPYSHPYFMQLWTAADQSACHYDFALRYDSIYSNTVFLSVFMAGYGALQLSTALWDGSRNYPFVQLPEEVELLEL